MGNTGQGDWPAAAPPGGNDADGASAFVAANKTEVQEQEDDEAWGDWGGASDEEPDDASPGISRKEVPLPSFVPNGNQSQSTSAKWHDQPVPMQFKAERLKGDQELELPPQLVHEEAWPELGGGAASKSGSKKGR